MNGATQQDVTLAEKFHIVAGAQSRLWTDEQVLNDLFRRLLTNYVRMRLGKHAAEWEDALQAAFSDAWEHRGEAPQDAKSMRIWLFMIARSVCVDMVRKLRRFKPFIGAEPISAAPGPETQVRRKEIAASVHAALARMPETLAELVRMHHLERKSMEEIAALTGVAVRTLYRQLEQAKTWFQTLVTTIRRRKPARAGDVALQPAAEAMSDPIGIALAAAPAPGIG